MLILFDIDDTLVDHTGAATAGARVLHESVGSPLQRDEFLTRWGEALERNYDRYLAGELTLPELRRERVRDVVDRALTDAAADRLADIYQSGYEAGWSLFPDVTACLDRLASSHSLGIISNGDTRQQRNKLTAAGIAERFACILISEECGHSKPSKEIFLRACQIAGEPVTNAIYVGDRYDVDAEGARAAGLAGVWLDRRARATSDHLPPVIRGLDELARVLVEAGDR
jgi:putative hydrolase of the HAD superfamily